MRLSSGALRLGIAIVAITIAAPARAQTYKVIVNESNPVSALTRDQLSRFFLRPSSWEGGSAVVAVDLDESSPVRGVFSHAVLGRSVEAVRAGWTQQMFAGRGVPPTTRHSDAEVEALVASNVSAIGYVSAGAALESRVKILHVTDQ